MALERCSVDDDPRTPTPGQCQPVPRSRHALCETGETIRPLNSKANMKKNKYLKKYFLLFLAIC